MSGRPRRGWVRTLATLATLASLPLVAGAEVQRVETVGTARLPAADPRGEALDAAVAEAVQRVAQDLLTDAEDAVDSSEIVEALGGEPRMYAARFRLLEDRGERPALFEDGSGSGTEYVVVAAVEVDVDRVRERLEAARLLAGSTGPARSLTLEVMGLDSYAAFSAFCEALGEPLGRARMLPIEIERGRALFEIESPLGLDRLLARLRAAAPGDLDVVRLAPSGSLERLAVRWTPGG